ncbi:MAG: hypothetical protein QOI12_4621 [Alphaproteobacteria bacterium]|jgi:hypothetical protein|nr:hypothetical protein [Alphaproteobacteria bacterium]
MSKRPTTISLAGLAALLALAFALAGSAQADGIRKVTCYGGRHSVNCVETWQRWTPQPPAPPTAEELAQARERERQWEARCRPMLRQDNFGVARYVYAAPGCEYGKLD